MLDAGVSSESSFSQADVSGNIKHILSELEEKSKINERMSPLLTHMKDVLLDEAYVVMQTPHAEELLGRICKLSLSPSEYSCAVALLIAAFSLSDFGEETISEESCDETIFQQQSVAHEASLSVTQNYIDYVCHIAGASGGSFIQFSFTIKGSSIVWEVIQ